RAPTGARMPHSPTPPEGRKPPSGTIDSVGASRMSTKLTYRRNAKFRVRANAMIAPSRTRAYTNGTYPTGEPKMRYRLPHTTAIGRINTEVRTSSALPCRVCSSSRGSAPIAAKRASTTFDTIRRRRIRSMPASTTERYGTSRPSTPKLLCESSNRECDDADDSGRPDHKRLRQLRSPEHQERREEDDDGRHIDDDLRRDDRSGTDDRAGRGGGGALREPDDDWVFPIAHDPGSEEHDHQKRRQKHPEACHRRAGKTSDQITHEDRGDDDRPGRDHSHRDCVQELALAQPAEVVHHALLQEWHDREARTERERAGFEEKNTELQEDVRVRALCRRPHRAESDGDRHRGSLRSPEPTSRRVDRDANEPREKEQHRDLAARGEGDDADHGENRPQPPLVLHCHPNQLPGAAKDQRDNRRTDAVEECLDDRRPAKCDVERSDRAHDDERGHDERDRRRARAPEPAADVSEPHRKLGRERTRQGLRHREALEVF